MERVPVVLLTAKGFTKDRIEGYQGGADTYLTKPFDPDELLDIVNILILRRQQMAEAQGRLANGTIRYVESNLAINIFDGIRHESGGETVTGRPSATSKHLRHYLKYKTYWIRIIILHPALGIVVSFYPCR